MTNTTNKVEYDQIGIIGFGPLFNKLSEYYNEENQKINLSNLDQFQLDLDLEVEQWSISENTRSKILSGECKKSKLDKYRNRINCI